MSLFIAGTGTEVGKTLVTAALVHQLGPPWRARKPVASGVSPGNEASDPAILARAQGCLAQEISLYALQAPLAPDRAAEAEGVTLSWPAMLAACQGDALLIEGAGGLYSPLTAERTNADLAQALGLPVLLVAGTALGTISHTLSTLKAARAEGLRVIGLVLSASPGGDAPEEIAARLRILYPALPSCFALPRIMGADPWRRAPVMRPWLLAQGLIARGLVARGLGESPIPR